MSTLATQRLYRALRTLLHDVGWRKKINQFSVKVEFEFSMSFFDKNSFLISAYFEYIMLTKHDALFINVKKKVKDALNISGI